MTTLTSPRRLLLVAVTVAMAGALLVFAPLALQRVLASSPADAVEQAFPYLLDAHPVADAQARAATRGLSLAPADVEALVARSDDRGGKHHVFLTTDGLVCISGEVSAGAGRKPSGTYGSCLPATAASEHGLHVATAFEDAMTIVSLLPRDVAGSPEIAGSGGLRLRDTVEVGPLLITRAEVASDVREGSVRVSAEGPARTLTFSVGHPDAP